MADSERRVVVSGGSGGIGRAIVFALASEGDEVVALGRDSGRLAALERRARAHGLNVTTRICTGHRVPRNGDYPKPAPSVC